VINFNSLQFWLAALGIFIAIVALLAIVRGRHERRRSSAEMRDYIRRNFRIGQQHWE
jgi:hypothetical protein